MANDRRSFLKTGLLGGAVLTLGGASFLAFRGGKSAEPLAPLLVFSGGAYSVMVALIEVVVPVASAVPRDAAQRIDTSLSYAPPRIQGEIQSALGLLENGLAGVFTRGQMAPFSTLSLEDRAAALLAWRDSSIALLNSAYDALRKLAIAGHYSDLERAKETGYPGPPFVKKLPWEIEPRKALSAPYVPRDPNRMPEPTSPDTPVDVDPPDGGPAPALAAPADKNGATP